MTAVIGVCSGSLEGRASGAPGGLRPAAGGREVGRRARGGVRLALAALAFLSSATVDLCGQETTRPTTSMTAPDGDEEPPRNLLDDPRTRRWRVTLLMGLALIVVLLAASIAIIVFSRNFRNYLTRKPAAPTRHVDVWRMHRLPEEDDPADGDSGESDGN